MASSQTPSHQGQEGALPVMPGSLRRDTTPHSDHLPAEGPPIWKESRTDWTPSKRVSGVAQAQREGKVHMAVPGIEAALRLHQHHLP